MPTPTIWPFGIPKRVNDGELAGTTVATAAPELIIDPNWSPPEVGGAGLRDGGCPAPETGRLPKAKRPPAASGVDVTTDPMVAIGKGLLVGRLVGKKVG